MGGGLRHRLVAPGETGSCGGALLCTHIRTGRVVRICAQSKGRTSTCPVPRGIDQLWVTANGRALDFYRRFGFTVIETVQLANENWPVTALVATMSTARVQQDR